LIKIRGGISVQQLPLTLVKSWKTFTFNPFAASSQFSLAKVEDEGDEGWTNPTSFDDLFLPEDLPLPKAVAAVGCCVNAGVVRYIMPSLILSLETPDKIWRNRGLCSLPRSRVWLDLFSQFTPPTNRLSVSVFGKGMDDVRFLEDLCR